MLPVPESINFAKEEEKILEFWKSIDAFKTSLNQSKGKPKYTFYDGPPFATGLPHYGHILAGTIKDIVTRFAHQSGFHVDRRFGWDTHGLPVEYEIDKTLGIKGPEDVAKMGIDKYNAECRKIVMRYAGEWETVVARMGRWIDFENDYKTMYPWFMESVWWVFKQLFVKGLVYKGFKVMPFSTACSTPLSNFESGQNYKDVVDPAVIVSFPLDSDTKTSLLAWTTTPWTLPSNLALCVNPGLTYVKVKDAATGNVYILMESRLVALYKSEEEYTILEKCLGSKLKGLTYEPLFPYFAHLKKQGAFKVLTDTYVTEESGTGVVHQSPYFGEEDFRVCLAAGVITKDQDMVCPVDESGRFTVPVQDFLGMHVKDADKHIIKHLTDKKRMVHSGQTKHSYPFCWRSETPLIYKAVPSWFIRVEQMSQRLLDNNQQTYWVPEFVKEKRFANWLRDARDWAVSRNRYWGTPIPLWVSEDGEEIICVGSVEELKELSGVLVTDLHRETVDTIEIPSARPGKPPLKRVTEVFDCWFESGSMPYAQAHYPFEHKREFENSFPADFIAEGIDQTRGWFYTLLVLSTALFDTPPFKNLIVNGLVLASDGQKMSKSKKNFPDPLQIVNKFGADALRLYLINSPVVRAENLRFKEEGVRDIVKDVFLPWYNAYRFFAQNLERWEREENLKFSLDEDTLTLSPNLMDRWLVSFVQSLLEFVKAEMRAYRLYTVVPRLVRFVDQLTNWYVRMNRKRLKGDSGREDCQRALETLFSVLLNLTKIMAPFTPFLTELMYKNLKSSVTGNQNDSARASVHFLPLPEPRTGLMDRNIERAVARMQTVIELGRVIRDRKTIPIKYPLKEVVVIHRDPQCLADLKALERYIVEELNVRGLTLTSDKASYGVTLRAEPDHKTLGARLKDAFKPVTLAIKALSDAQLQTFLTEGKMEVGGHLLGLDDVRLFYSFAGEKAAELALQYEAHSDNDILVMLDISPDQAMQEEGIAREVINRVQKLRKKAKLLPSDEVLVHYQVSPNDNSLATIVTNYTEFIEATIKMPLRPLDAVSFSKTTVIIEEVQQLKGAELKLVVTKNQGKAEAAETFVIHGSPACKFVNLFFHDSKVVRGGTLLLENAQSEAFLTTTELLKQAGLVFNLVERNVMVKTLEGKDVVELDIKTLHGQTLVVYSKAGNNGTTTLNHLEGSVCRFVNVQRGEKVATILLENPVGSSLRPAELRQVVEAALRLGSSSKAQFYAEKECKSRVNFPDGILQFNGKTLYISA